MSVIVTMMGLVLFTLQNEVEYHQTRFSHLHASQYTQHDITSSRATYPVIALLAIATTLYDLFVYHGFPPNSRSWSHAKFTLIMTAWALAAMLTAVVILWMTKRVVQRVTSDRRGGVAQAVMTLRIEPVRALVEVLDGRQEGGIRLGEPERNQSEV
jgi:hypothetical protein